MKAYVKAFLFRGLCGIFIGSFIGHTLYAIAAFQMDGFEVTSKAVLINYFATGLVGFWCTSISVVYDIEEWSILRQTITHAILISPYIPIAFVLGWAPASVSGRILMVIFYIIAYIVIWSIIKAYWTKKSRELNEGIEKLNSL